MKGFKVGDYVKIHPAADAFAHGMSYGTIIEILNGCARVRHILGGECLVRFTDIERA